MKTQIKMRTYSSDKMIPVKELIMGLTLFLAIIYLLEQSNRKIIVIEKPNN
jgi:hypothetical protein